MISEEKKVSRRAGTRGGILDDIRKCLACGFWDFSMNVKGL